MGTNKKQELLSLLKASYGMVLPFYQQLNTLNRSKTFLEAKRTMGFVIGLLLGVPLAVLAFQLSNRISGYIHSFYVDAGPFPFYLFAPVWVEVLLFTGGLIMIIASIVAPVSAIYYILKRISRNKYQNVSREITAIWDKLHAKIKGWNECPITLQYSHPQWITAIYNTIDTDCAMTVNQAVQALEEDERHRQHINAQIEAQKAHLAEQKRKQQAEDDDNEFELLFWLNETNQI